MLAQPGGRPTISPNERGPLWPPLSAKMVCSRSVLPAIDAAPDATPVEFDNAFWQVQVLRRLRESLPKRPSLCVSRTGPRRSASHSRFRAASATSAAAALERKLLALSQPHRHMMHLR